MTPTEEQSINDIRATIQRGIDRSIAGGAERSAYQAQMIVFDKAIEALKAQAGTASLDTLAVQQGVTGPTGEGLAGFAKDLPGEGPEHQPSDAELIAWALAQQMAECDGWVIVKNIPGIWKLIYRTHDTYDMWKYHMDKCYPLGADQTYPTLTPAAREILTGPFLAWRKEKTND